MKPKHASAGARQGSDPARCADLARELTPYPPGSAVRLVKGEIAVVCRRTRQSAHPVARAVVATGGRTFPETRQRVTCQPAYAISKAVGQAELKQFPDPKLLWDDACQAGA